MGWLFKVVLTAGVVLLVLVATHQGTHRWAAVVAALPTIAAPMPARLAHKEDVAFAISAAIGMGCWRFSLSAKRGSPDTASPLRRFAARAGHSSWLFQQSALAIA